MTGVTRKPVRVVLGQAAEDLDALQGKPDLFLRLAQRGELGARVARSARPPGKLTCPEWLLRCCVRWVKRTVRPCACAITGISTAAAVVPLRPAPSSP